MKKINEMMISAYLKGMSKLNAFKDNESGEVNMVAIVLIIISCFSVCSFLFISECIFCKVCLSTRRPRKLLLSSARVWL